MSETPTSGSSAPPPPAHADGEREGGPGPRRADHARGRPHGVDTFSVDPLDEVARIELAVGRTAAHHRLDEHAVTVVLRIAGGLAQDDVRRVELALVPLA